jgi:peptide chain release factor subunit 1
VQVTNADIRELVSRDGGGLPFTSVYLNTDGARFPRTADYEARLDGLLREVRKEAEGSDDDRWSQAVLADADAISRFVRREFTRKDTRGLGMFASGGELIDTVETALPLRNVARVGARPYVVPLEALLGRSHHIALAVVSRDRARVFRYRLGRLEEHEQVQSDVHRQHEQGGWSQARYQRNVEHDVVLHMKDVAEVLRRLVDREPVDALVLAGPGPDVAQFERILHPYVRDLRHGEALSLSLHAGPDEIKKALSEVEQELVSARRRELLARLAAARGQAEHAARGVRHVLEAVNAKRVETLFVVEGAGEPGYKSVNGALALHEDEAAAYGGPVHPVADLVDEIIEEAVRSDAHIELFRDPSRLDGDPVSALLRF